MILGAVAFSPKPESACPRPNDGRYEAAFKKVTHS